MPDFFVWCAHCGDPHDLSVEVCPTTRKPVKGNYPRGSTRPFVGTKIGGRYLLRSPIGEGGVGAVFEAEHVDDGKSFAVKVLKPKANTSTASPWRLEREARLASSIVHPNVCRVFEVGQLDSGEPYLVMERLLGETLRAKMKREGCLDLREAVGIIIQVLSGLAAAHELGIVHRDVTPQNIFLLASSTRPPPVKLLDFGLSKQVEESRRDDFDKEMSTKTGIAVGTLEYMPPEQARAEEVDSRVDLYACGVTLYEALTAVRPFRGTNINRIAYASRNTRLPLPAELRMDLPPLVDLIVSRAMAVNPADRFSDAGQFIRALEPLLEASVETAKVRPFPVDEPEEVVVTWSEGSAEITSEPTTEQRRVPVEEATEEEMTVPRLRRRDLR